MTSGCVGDTETGSCSRGAWRYGHAPTVCGDPVMHRGAWRVAPSYRG